MDYQQAIDLIKARLEWYRGKEDEAAIKVCQVLLEDLSTWQDTYKHQLRLASESIARRAV